jgi:hypothetical protein
MQYNIDKNRIYCCGFSNGGHMTHKLAYWVGYRFAAVASVCGTMTNTTADDTYHFDRSMPFLICNGTMDPFLPYYGGTPGKYAIEKTLEFWVQNNNCLPTADTLAMENTNTNDLCKVEKIRYTNSSDSVQVLFYKIINGGHTWPGGDRSVWSGGGSMNKDINVNVEIWNFFKNIINPYTHIACGKLIASVPGYMNPKGDSLLISARITNPENHATAVFAILEGINCLYRDSVELFDDGMHNDENPQDDSYGKKSWFTGLREDNYELTLKTVDQHASTHHYLRKKALFTTIGPVCLAQPSPILYGAYTEESGLQIFKLILENKGDSTIAEDISAVVKCTDPRVLQVNVKDAKFSDIGAGSKETCSNLLSFNYSDGYNPDSTINNPIAFSVDIYSEGVHYWTDSTNHTATFIYSENQEKNPQEYRLYQNYPNPFNPSTTIKIHISKASQTTLKVFDILGKEVATLVSDKLNAGNHTFYFDGSRLASGIYYYQLDTGEYKAVRKMILVR